MDSSISYLTQELQNLTLRKRPNLDKKYFIDKETRTYIKQQSQITIGLIPFQSRSNPIYNPKKKLFINNTHILTKSKRMISLTSSKKKCYLTMIKKYLETQLKIKLDLTKINKILDIENSKILLFTIDLTDIVLKLTNSCKLEDKMANLSLSETYELVKFTDFYNQIEVNKSKRELYRNITNLRANKTYLQKCIPLELETNYTIQFKYYMIYQRLY